MNLSGPTVTVGTNFTQPAKRNILWLWKSGNPMGPMTCELVLTNTMLKKYHLTHEIGFNLDPMFITDIVGSNIDYCLVYGSDWPIISTFLVCGNSCNGVLVHPVSTIRYREILKYWQFQNWLPGLAGASKVVFLPFPGMSSFILSSKNIEMRASESPGHKYQPSIY